MVVRAENSPVTVTRGNPASTFMFVCEHASCHMPEEFENLGLDDEARVSHIAWDPGALAVTDRLREVFDAHSVTSNISRLIYDCNRTPQSPSAVPTHSEIHPVPGNCDLTKEQHAHRVETYYRPFERTLESEIRRLSVKPVLVTIHSFTPVYKGKNRDVELGILHDADTRFADAMLAQAAQHTSFNVQRNQPYGPQDDVTHTLKRHGLENGLLNVMVEIRSDHLQSLEACHSVADMLANWLADALEQCSGQFDPLEASA